MLEFAAAFQHNYKTSCCFFVCVNQIWEPFWLEEQKECSPVFWFSPHLLPSHQEEVHSSNVDTNVMTEILEDFPYEWARAEGDGRAGAVRKHHAALTGRSLPRANWVAIITLDVQRIHVQLVLWQLFNIYFKKMSGLELVMALSVLPWKSVQWNLTSVLQEVAISRLVPDDKEPWDSLRPLLPQ